MSRTRLCQQFDVRLWMIGGIFALGLVVLYGFLWRLQVRDGDDQLERVQQRIIRRIRESPVRGRIFSSDGLAVVDNRTAYDLVFHVAEMRQPGSRSRTIEYVFSSAYRLGQMLGRSTLPFCEENEAGAGQDLKLSFAQFRQRYPDLYGELCRRIEYHLYYTPAMPLTAYRDLAPRDRSILEEMLPPVPGLAVMPRYGRAYPFPSFASQVLGFTASARITDTYERKRYSYSMPDLRGRSGLENFYDDRLSGKPGMRMVMVDSLGYPDSPYGVTAPPLHGNDLHLTIDSRAQRAAELALAMEVGGSRPKAAALVVMDVQTGAIIAMASAPTFSLEGMSSRRYAELLADPGQPMTNRVVGAYQPGSIIKPLLCLTALETGAVLPDELISCNGVTHIGNSGIRCAARYGHGELDMVQGIAHSCNCFMIEIALRPESGLDAIAQIYAAAGLGERPGIDLPYAARGILPSSDYVRNTQHRRWTAFDTALIAIGQGPVSLSPLQAVTYTAAIANGGTIYRPRLVNKITMPGTGEVVREIQPEVVHRLPVDIWHLKLVRQGMEQAVYNKTGTSVRARNAAITIAGKTGTAEVGSGTSRHKNCWFIGFAPCDSPKYAICVMVENGVSGGSDSAPRAKAFFEAWLGPAAIPPEPLPSAPSTTPGTDEADPDPQSPMLDDAPAVG
jgi:penicillin-binding protein 2